MRIREIQTQDRAEWLRLLLGFYAESSESDHAPSVDAFLAGSSSQSLLPSAVFVAERTGSGLCGFLELSVRNYAEGCRGATPYVESWYVDPDVRGTGIGRQLVGAAEGWAQAHGFSELASDAELSNTLSQEVHLAVGFSEVERIAVFRKKLSAAG
jgi:aminoglycoside 6'-N-acetyltransferase I